MSLGKAVIWFENMDEEMQKFAIEQAQDSLNTMFHEQVRTISLLIPIISLGTRNIYEEIIRD